MLQQALDANAILTKTNARLNEKLFDLTGEKEISSKDQEVSKTGS